MSDSPADDKSPCPVVDFPTRAAPLYRAAVQAAAEGVAVACHKTGAVLLVNPALCRMLGYDEATLLTMTVFDLHPAEMRSFVRMAFDEACRGVRPVIPALLFQRSDGTLFPGDVHAAPFELDGRPCVVGMLTDRTEQQALQTELMGVRDWLRALVEALPYPVFAKDRARRFTLVNPAWEAFLGVRSADALGRTIDDVFPAAVAALHRPSDERLLEQGGSASYEAHVATPAGEARDVLFSKAATRGRDGAVTGLVGSVIDLTGLKRAETALAESEGRLRAMLEAANTVAFVIADARTDDVPIREFSPGAERLFGWSRAEALGRPVSALAAEPRRLFGSAAPALERSSVRDEMQLVRRDGATFPAMVTVRALRQGSTPTGEVLLVAVDLSRVRAADLERERMAEQLRQSQKMESLGTLAGGIAHDFNNLLGVILGHAEVVRDALPEADDAEGGQALTRLVSATYRARDLVRRLLAFARRADSAPRDVSLTAVVEEAVRLVRATIPVSMTIQLELDPVAAFVQADPVQLQQVLINLATNAWHAMEPAGTLSVRVVRLDAPGEGGAAAADLPPGRWVLLEVRDTGHGMDEATVARMFEPYFTTKGPGRGTGLGLSVVHGIVTAHGGRIRVSSRPGAGTRVCVYLPRLEAPVVEAPAAPEPAPAHGHGRVLLADDDDELRELLSRHLRGLGYEVAAFPSGEHALAHARNASEPFDVLVTDMTMPGMSGADLADRIRELLPGLPVIVCTGYSDLLDEAEAARRGFDRFLMKPVGRADLARALQGVLGGRP